MTGGYPMTWQRSSAPRRVLGAFAGHRWHTTDELAVHAHYTPAHTLRVLKHLAQQGAIEASGTKRATMHGQPWLWRIPETRWCGYCDGPKTLDHFYKNYRTGGWYPGCITQRHHKYVTNLEKV